MPNCRECPETIRLRCIEKCATSSSVKIMMQRAFDAGTDTEELWGLLQASCLLEKESRSHRRSALGERLARKPEPAETAIEEPSKEPTKHATPPPPTRAPAAQKPVARPAPTPAPRTKRDKPEPAPAGHYGLILQDDQHHIALPADGMIVLGRFDPAINVTPDVDLSYDDRNDRVISRRHARIFGHRRRHEIEDLGSTNGTSVNGKRLVLGQRILMRPGDHVTLGYCRFLYNPLPRIDEIDDPQSYQAFFRVCFTGNVYPLPSQGEGIIGRRDENIDFFPNVDLSDEEDVAQVVARRHVRIIAREGLHYVEDLGSASGSKVNGKRLKLGQLSPLTPGDHLWLGGCVLGYDIREGQPDTDATRLFFRS